MPKQEVVKTVEVKESEPQPTIKAVEKPQNSPQEKPKIDISALFGASKT